jgi:DNA-binding NarL/FixJ family response regulator
MVTAVAVCDDPNMQVTVLIVDDHEGFRASARSLLELDGFAVVGEAVDGRSALELVRELQPELVLLDVALPDLSGFDVVERLTGARAKVILTSSRERQDFGQRVRSSGALGFVPKDRLSGAALRALMRRRS